MPFCSRLLFAALLGPVALSARADELKVEKGDVDKRSLSLQLRGTSDKESPYCRGVAQVTDRLAPSPEHANKLLQPKRPAALGRLEIKLRRDDKSPCKKSSKTYTADLRLQRGDSGEALRDGLYVVVVNGEALVRLSLDASHVVVEPFGCQGKTMYLLDEKTHKCRVAKEHECGPQVLYDDLITCKMINHELACDPRHCDPM